MNKIALAAAALIGALSTSVQAATPGPSIVLTGLSSAQIDQAIMHQAIARIGQLLSGPIGRRRER